VPQLFDYLSHDRPNLLQLLLMREAYHVITPYVKYNLTTSGRNW
jgi:hypothetical protein